jgi:hypothetical protein
MVPGFDRAAVRSASRSSVVLLALLLGGCMSATHVRSTWHEPEGSRGPYGKILVIGVSDIAKRRRSFEESMIGDITSSQTRGWSSLRQMGASQPINRETLTPIVKALGADAVLVTRLVSRKVIPNETESRTEMQSRQQAPSDLNNPDNIARLFTYQYQEHEEPGELRARSQVIVDTQLYEANDGGKLVYSMTVDTTFTETEGDVMAEISTAIANRLRADNLIR